MTCSPKAESATTRCLAVDLGAGSGRIVLGELKDRRWELEEVGRFQTPTKIDGENDYQCWDIEQIAGSVESHIASARSRGTLASVGVDSWGVDFVLLDKELQMVGTPVCYRDPRTLGVMEDFQLRVPREEIYRRTGIQFLSFNTLYQLVACVEKQADWIEQARHFLMIPDYLHFRLSGKLSNEYTNATTTQVCGLDGEWDPLLLKAIGVNRDLMRSPIAAGSVLGDGEWGARGLKVIAPGTHDTASAVAGTPLQSEDEAYISSGTWSLMGIEREHPIATPEALRMNFTNEGGLERRFRILKNIMGMWPVQRLCEEWGIRDFGALVQQASAAEAWRSIVNVNDTGFLNPHSMTQAIQDFCRRSSQPVPETVELLARCIFDSLALSYKTVKDELELLRGRKLTQIRIVGGGCQNKLLNQLCADACGVPVIAGPIEASVLGNLSAQMIALGEIENLSQARQLICRSFELIEHHQRAEVPSRVVECFEELLAADNLKGETYA